MTKPEQPDIDWGVTTWEGSRRDQLRRSAAMTLRERLEAVEGMARLSERLQRMRERSAPPAARVREPEAPSEHGVRNTILLPGCTPEPLMNYLKALGVLRLVAEQQDAGARGWWKGDAFDLRSTLDSSALVRFFLEEYKPTPIVGPWAGGSGFFKKDNKKAVEAILRSGQSRLADYKAVIDAVLKILEEEKVADKPSDETKVRLLQRYRRELPLPVVDWMDAAMVLQEDGQAFAPLLGTGGNDGRLDFTQNFMGRLITLGIGSGRPHERSEKWLRNTLFAVPTDWLENAAVGQFAPGRAGGANATQGIEGQATDNPWDYVLMLEGSLVLAGAAVRRLEAGDAARASFPFTILRVIAAGYASAAESDDVEARGEIWLPLWDRPAALGELRTLFAEGRADVSGRRARHALDFARAAATLGVDRGIKQFSRYSFLKRSGKAYLASPLGRFEVRERREVDLLREIDLWLDDFRRAATEKNRRGQLAAPPRFRAALRSIDQAIFDLCRYGGSTHLQSVLISLGRAERELAVTPGRFGKSKVSVRPLSRLSSEWTTQSDDGTTEYAIARALAAVHDPERKIGSLRTNLEAVGIGADQLKRPYANWSDKERHVVWSAAELPTNLAAVLDRRCMDGLREGCENLPLASPASVGLGAVRAFMNAAVDDRRLEDLLWGLMLVEVGRGDRTRNDQEAADAPIPRAYALLKLLFLARPLTIEHPDNGALRVHLTRPGEEGIRIRPEPAIVHLLRACRLGEACVIAMRRLRASGLNPLPRPIRGRGVRDDDWRELDAIDSAFIDPRRLAASLLIPISERAVNMLGDMITDPEFSEDIVASEGRDLSIVAQGG